MTQIVKAGISGRTYVTGATDGSDTIKDGAIGTNLLGAPGTCRFSLDGTKMFFLDFGIYHYNPWFGYRGQGALRVLDIASTVVTTLYAPNWDGVSTSGPSLNYVGSLNNIKNGMAVHPVTGDVYFLVLVSTGAGASRPEVWKVNPTTLAISTVYLLDQYLGVKSPGGYGSGLINAGQMDFSTDGRMLYISTDNGHMVINTTTWNGDNVYGHYITTGGYSIRQLGTDPTMPVAAVPRNMTEYTNGNYTFSKYGVYMYHYGTYVNTLSAHRLWKSVAVTTPPPDREYGVEDNRAGDFGSAGNLNNSALECGIYPGTYTGSFSNSPHQDAIEYRTFPWDPTGLYIVQDGASFAYQQKDIGGGLFTNYQWDKSYGDLFHGTWPGGGSDGPPQQTLTGYRGLGRCAVRRLELGSADFVHSSDPFVPMQTFDATTPPTDGTYFLGSTRILTERQDDQGAYGAAPSFTSVTSFDFRPVSRELWGSWYFNYTINQWAKGGAQVKTRIPQL